MGNQAGARVIEPNPPDAEAPGSFDAVYAEQRTAIVRVAFLIVRSQAIAEELTQEAFLRLYRDFDAVENPAGFLRTAVARLAITARSRADMERERTLRVVRSESVGTIEPDETWDAIGRLRPDRAAVLVLRFYEDLEHREIARILNCPTATVRSRLRRALSDLRKELENEEGER